jgi:hypothetical protein
VTTTTTDLDTHRLEQLVLERTKVAADRDALAAALADGHTDVGDYQVTVTRPQRLNTAALEAAFPVTKHPHLYTAKIDTAAVKEHLAPTDLAQYKTAGAATVRVK